MGTSSVRKVGVTPFFPAAVTATTIGDQKEPYHTNRTFEAYGTTASGSGSATIIVEVRNDESSPWLTMGTITLTLGVTSTADGFVSSAAWRYVRARVSAITGTGASVQANMGSSPL